MRSYYENPMITKYKFQHNQNAKECLSPTQELAIKSYHIRGMVEFSDQKLCIGNENVVVEENLSFRQLDMLNNNVIQNLGKRFTVEIKVKEKQKVISTTGMESAVEEVKAELLKEVINIFENGTKSVFFVGMSDEDELVIEQLFGSTGIRSYNASLGNEVRFQSIPGLKNRLLTIFNKAKSCMVDADTTVSTEVSIMQLKNPGVYRIKNVLETPGSIYVRSFPGNYLQQLIQDYHLIHEEPIRHDLRIKISDTGEIIIYRMHVIGKRDTVLILGKITMKIIQKLKSVQDIFFIRLKRVLAFS
ncbi:uncharacterized protein LOC130648882 [Hydractinia symbiolongicarpus]|uniref:uncharacterized protein LOC130648882 n=1 Tax=Hydractinia symbiolongicarpus TaxID=13093 RepID=UPI00254C7A9F|nr:uncharacterized protein LOC130648882 [Hydractinia symbiolongicarpus]